MTPARRFHRRLLLLCAVHVAVCTVIVLALPRDVVWSGDSFLKLAQIRALRWGDGGWQGGHFHFDIPYPGQAYDPAWEYVPIGDSFFDTSHGEVRLVWPLPFFLVTYPFYKAFGSPGLFALPILGGAAIVGLTGAITERLRANRGLFAALVVGAATPILTYSTLFWEHLPAVALGLLGLFLAMPDGPGESEEATAAARPRAVRRLVLAGVCLAVAAGALRAELDLFLLAVVGARLCVSRTSWRPALVIAGSALASSVPLWWMNLTLTGHLLPLNAAKNFTTVSGNYLGRAWPSLLHDVIVGVNAPEPEGTVITATVVGLLVVSALLRRYRPLVLLAGFVALVVLSFASVEAKAMLEQQRVFHGLFVCSPLLALGMICRTPSGPRAAFVWRTGWCFAIAYVVSICLTSPEGPAAGSLELGPRFALVLYPILAIRVAVIDVPGGALQRPCVAALALALGIGVFFQAASLTRVSRDSVVARGMKEALERTTEPVVTDQWWLPSTSVENVLTRPSFRVANVSELPRFASVLRAHGLRSVVFVSFARPTTPIALDDGATCEWGASRMDAGLLLTDLRCPE